ncbi:MAG: Gfo/Idh/MocA family oxidoreductase [Clostridia bacterium]|nr:Gfo/Idh/MocA family oxidoreductase [Clostridia bacterium]
MEKIRLGVVGLGNRGRMMILIATKYFDCAELVAACDIRPNNWFETQQWFDKPYSELHPNTKFYEDYEEMLDKEKLDAVLVETDGDFHAKFCVMALERGINVMSDIPCVDSLEEAEMLWKASEASKAMMMVGANPNEQRFAVLLQDFYKKGLLGKPYYLEAEYIHPILPGTIEEKLVYANGDWRKRMAPIRYCTHSLGPLLTILEEDLRKVTCLGTGFHTPESYKHEMMSAQAQTDSGIIVKFMRNGRCRSFIGHHNYRVFGTEGYMERMDRMGKAVIRYNSTKELDTSLKEVNGEFMPPRYEGDARVREAGHGGMDYALWDDFFDALINKKPSPITVRQGLAMTLPGIYAAESAERGGKMMRIKYPWDSDWSLDMEEVK